MRANRAHQIFYIVNEIQVSLKIFQEKGVLSMAITKQKNLMTLYLKKQANFQIFLNQKSA